MRSQLETTPPYSGADMVADANDAFQTIATDFAGATDPAAMAWPYATWADTGNMLLKRRNAADTAWVSEGALFSGLKGIASTAQAQALTADDVVITPKKLDDALNVTTIGRGQTPQNVTASRALNTTYTNTTGRPIWVMIYWEAPNPCQVTIREGGAGVLDIAGNGSSAWATSRAIIPAGSNYHVSVDSGTGPVSILAWAELR